MSVIQCSAGSLGCELWRKYVSVRRTEIEIGHESSFPSKQNCFYVWKYKSAEWLSLSLTCGHCTLEEKKNQNYCRFHWNHFDLSLPTFSRATLHLLFFLGQNGPVVFISAASPLCVVSGLSVFLSSFQANWKVPLHLALPGMVAISALLSHPPKPQVSFVGFKDKSFSPTVNEQIKISL